MIGVLSIAKIRLKLIQVLALISLSFIQPSVMAIEVGDTLALGSLQTIDGQTLDASQWKQRNTLVHVWATWCGYCHQQNEHLSQLIKKIPPGSLNVVTISIDKKPEQVHKYLEKHRYDFPVVMMNKELAAAIGKRRGVPELYVLNPQGKVIQKDYGLMVDLDFFELGKYARPVK